MRDAAVVLAGTGGLVAAMILAVPGIASATTLACGSTITTNTTLTANMNCTHYTSGPAVTIGMAGVTLNLNGHEILGPGDSAQTEGIADGSGIQAGYSGVTVENGSLSNFYYDVYFYGASGADLTGIVAQHLTITDKTLLSSTSVIGYYLDGASFNHVTSTDAYGALVLIDSEDSTGSGNKVNLASYGAYDASGTADTWSGNTITDTQEYQAVFTSDTTDDVIENNTISGSAGADGIYNDDPQNITVTGNSLNDLYAGIVDYDGSDGTISHNAGTGDLWGIYTYETTDYTLTGNTFGHGQYGIQTDYPNGEVLTGNTADHNSEAGVFVSTSGQTSGYSATLTANTGNDNRYGLYSQIPTTGSGNHATGNKVVNCYNVKCTKAKAGRSVIAAPPQHPFAMRTAPARWARQ